MLLNADCPASLILISCVIKGVTIALVGLLSSTTVSFTVIVEASVKVATVKVPIERSIDIDNYMDFAIAKFLMENPISYKEVLS